MDELIKLDQVDEIMFGVAQEDEQPLSIGEGVAILGDVGIGEEELNKILETKADISYVDEKFNGANKSVSFVNYSSMISSLNALPNTSYNVGQNIMIVTLEVPDLWVSEVVEESMAYTYVSDNDFVTNLKTNGSVQVGHYKLSALETQKVDLTDYVKNTDYANSQTAGVVKIGNIINGIAIDEVGTIYLQPASQGNIDKKTSYQPITPSRFDYALKVGLTTNTETLTETEKEQALAWLGAVKKTTDGRQIYGTDWQGVPTTYRIDYPNDATVNGIPVRAANGAIQINDASCEDGGSGSIADGTQAVNKNYVKRLIAENVGDINTTLESILGV